MGALISGQLLAERRGAEKKMRIKKRETGAHLESKSDQRLAGTDRQSPIEEAAEVGGATCPLIWLCESTNRVCFSAVRDYVANYEGR
jgi:hypothetical protein